MADEFTFSNLKRVVYAIGRHLQEEKKGEPIKVVIGHDPRFFSPEFATTAAEVLLNMGLRVHLLPEVTPTPATAYAIKAFQASGAVMITASHNPPLYNGIKFIPEYAGPALPAVTSSIERYLEEDPEEIELLSLEKGRREGRLFEESVKPIYLHHLLSLIQGEKMTGKGLRVALDPMHGAGANYLESIMEKLGIPYRALHQERDPLFGGGLPDPSESRLSELKELVEEGYDLGIGLDGDADRFGIICHGEYFTPNQVLFMLYHYLLAERGFEGGVVRSIATTHMLDRVAERFGYPVYETPVGFKYVGEKLHEGEVVLGGEESGGFSMRGHIPEKDGLLASLLILEMVAVMDKDLKEILSSLEEIYGSWVTDRLDLEYPLKERDRVLEEISSLTPKKIAGQEVEETNTLDGKKFLLANGAWALIRPSGTEPVVRIYVEAESIEMARAIQHDLRESVGL